jgi:putative endonuclease
MTLRALLEKILFTFRSGKKYRGLRGRGQEWESLAERHLKKAGYRILDRNVRTKVGEIDLVAEENGVLCFIEVKGRRGTGFGLPEEAVDAEKQRRIFRAAEAYLQSRRLGDRPCRFDVVAILQDKTASDVKIHRDAFAGPLPPRPRRPTW